jgi:hypothetical protein
MVEAGGIVDGGQGTAAEDNDGAMADGSFYAACHWLCVVHK